MKGNPIMFSVNLNWNTPAGNFSETLNSFSRKELAKHYADLVESHMEAALGRNDFDLLFPAAEWSDWERCVLRRLYDTIPDSFQCKIEVED